MANGTRDERAYLASLSFELFFCYYFIDYIRYPFAPFHFEAMENLQNLVDTDRKREFLWIGFRECAKSAVSRGFLTWLVLFKKRDYILVGSYAIENAESNLFAVVNAIQTNPRILADFGNVAPSMKGDEKGFNRIKKFLTTTGVLLEAVTTQQSPRGRLHKAKRPNFALLDDIETMKTSVSEAMTESTKNFLRELIPAMDSKEGRILYLGNHFSDLGVIQDLVNKSPRMYYQNNPIYYNGKPTWEAKYAMSDVEAKAEGKVSIEQIRRDSENSLVFEQEYMNTPMSEEHRIFKKSLFRHVKELPEGERFVTFVTIDPAFTKNSTSDNTGVAIVHVDSKGFWYARAFKYKLSPKELVEMVFTLYDRYKPEKIGIEKFSFTQGLKPYMDDEQRRRGKFLPLVELEHGGTSKETRITGLLSYYESETIKHIEGECADLEAELIRFPLGEHDDVADALAYMPKIAYKPYDDGGNFDNIPEELPQFPDIWTY